MSAPSIKNQLTHIFQVLDMDKEKIDAYKKAHHVRSVKKALRPHGDPTRSLPVNLARRTRDGYIETTTPFFNRAKSLTGRKLVADMMTEAILQQTLDVYYRDHMPTTLDTLLAALNKTYIGSKRLRWVKGACPVTPELRGHVKHFRDDGDVHQPRFGYKEKDAKKIVDLLKEKGSAFCLAAELALGCGLRLAEIAGLKGDDVDLEHGLLYIVGKGGKHRTVPLPADIGRQLNPSLPWIFRPTQSWKHAFYQAVRKAARELGIQISGVHRLRSNYAGQSYQSKLTTGKCQRAAMQEVSSDMGHNRTDVLGSYIPAKDKRIPLRKPE